MNKKMLMLVAGLAALTTAGCAGPSVSGTTESRDSRDMPEWSLNRPVVEGMIFGVGQAKKQNPSLAKTVAAQRAREEIASTVKVKVESLVKDFMQESGIGYNAKALEFTQSVSKGVTDATLTGAMIKEAFLARDGTYFVLMEYSLDNARRAAIESARQEEAAWSEINSDRGFEALEAELAKLRY
ncbi:MAG: LPP20 family lipoprotein [Candidatus Marinimicrobia bacterium]|nr:LPP20 family lipoprotein [Candidatus Neomarinimicrobiota bacterium]